jgi:hypothetical protein
VAILFTLLPTGKLTGGLRAGLLYGAGIVAAFWTMERVVSLPWV